MPKPPKPPKDPAAALTKLVSFRLTEPHHAAYAAKVSASGLTPSAYFRDAVLQNKTQIVARPKASPDQRRLVYLMNKASNNLNQLAHRANLDHLSGKVSEETYKATLRALQDLTNHMKSAVKNAN